MDTSKYKKIYLEEAYTHLSGIESGLLSISSGVQEETSESTIDNLFRHYHTLKGMSASMGYEAPTELAHVQEDLLSKIRSKELTLKVEIVETLLTGLDLLKEMISVVEEGSERVVECAGFIDTIKAACSTGPVTAVTAKPSAAAAQKEQHSAAKKMVTALKLSNTMKVDSSVFDDLQTTVGDLYMELSGFKTGSCAPGSIAFKDSVFSLGKTLNRLHASILTARMLPIANLTESLPRVVHDIARASGKEITMTIETGNIRLDRSILEKLGGPLLHIVRNSVDHAIELPEEREAAGKKRQAAIAINAYPRGEHVVVEVTDDGRGMDIDAIKTKALNSGYSYADLEEMSRAQILKLVCLPGLSTAKAVTDTSGRGVGMDVVKDSIESIGGRLTIASATGTGTTITMELPRTTSIIKALFISLSDELFLLPISAVSRVIEAAAEDARSKSITLDGLDIPLLQLGDLLGIKQRRVSGTDKEYYAIVIVDIRQTAYHGTPLTKEAHGLVGLVVDDFGFEIDAFIKPLQAPMTQLKGVSGITVTGTGRPVFLVDVAAVIEDAAQVK